ncbi:unnamed protein product [Staurois parvus]|uniref:Uncharacterized protein n=1 Tax=Staurois parvus TaxID=386267 RepID=A0ABN9HF61_9NEOB|nr:unnamed protein product [Staurois parvus]
MVTSCTGPRSREIPPAL